MLLGIKEHKVNRCQTTHKPNWCLTANFVLKYLHFHYSSIPILFTFPTGIKEHMGCWSVIYTIGNAVFSPYWLHKPWTLLLFHSSVFCLSFKWPAFRTAAYMTDISLIFVVVRAVIVLFWGAFNNKWEIRISTWQKSVNSKSDFHFGI